MHLLGIEPLIGIGPIKLGATRNDVRNILSRAGFPLEDTHDTIDYFCDAAIQVEFDDSDCVRFIGVSWHPAYILTFDGTNVFDVTANELFALLAERDSSGPHSYRTTDYFFPKQGINLWDAHPQYDRLRNETRPVWAQVGLGFPAVSS